MNFDKNEKEVRGILLSAFSDAELTALHKNIIQEQERREKERKNVLKENFLKAFNEYKQAFPTDCLYLAVEDDHGRMIDVDLFEYDLNACDFS